MLKFEGNALGILDRGVLVLRAQRGGPGLSGLFPSCPVIAQNFSVLTKLLETNGRKMLFKLKCSA